MTPQALPAPSQSLDIGDIYYLLFRHKWKILLCSIAGLAVAGAMYRAESPPYQSEAKLLVRYIVSTVTNAAPGEGAANRIVPEESRGASIMNTEKEILDSLDLAKEVAVAIGPEKILAKTGGGRDLSEAVGQIRRGLAVSITHGSNVIHVSFRHADPELVQPVLREAIEQYRKLHIEAHKAAGMLGDSLAQEAEILRSRLNQTEDELRSATRKAGILNLERAKDHYSNQIASINRDILNLETELAGRLAVFQDIKSRSPMAASAPAISEAESAKLSGVVEEYKTIFARLQRHKGQEQELLLQYPAESRRVKDVRAHVLEAEKALAKIRADNPELLRAISPATSAAGAPDAESLEATSAWLQITSLQAKIKELRAQLERTNGDAGKLEQMEGTILELRRKRDLQEEHYRYYAANLEQSRINETLGSGKVQNISQIQAPSPPFRNIIKMRKIGLTAVSGLALGLVWAFFIELYFDRSVRRPVDVQRNLRAPLFLSIPKLNASHRRSLQSGRGTRALMAPSDEKASAQQNSPAVQSADDHAGVFQPFHETLRDRLIAYFESKNLTHKPKLVAITSLGPKAGVTTTATGLARSLSETGEGNVLLVDMTVSQGAAQQFARGKEVCGLDEMLDGRTQAHVHENLYVVSEGSNSERLSRNLPQRFAKLIPKLKASDFDYIIFDMPMVSQLSITPRLAGFMDMVLLVIESEKTSRDVVQGACALLAESKAHVGVVLNKTKTYVPARLQQQLVTS